MRQASDRSHLRLAHSRGPAPMGMPPFNPGRRPSLPAGQEPADGRSASWLDRFGFLATIVVCAVGWFVLTRWLFLMAVR